MTEDYETMYKLVIIDDDRDVILGLRSYIQKQDSQILVSGFAYDGLSGFELISKERPDIILCDISMPKASGFQMIDKLHSNSDLRLYKERNQNQV